MDVVAFTPLLAIYGGPLAWALSSVATITTITPTIVYEKSSSKSKYINGQPPIIQDEFKLIDIPAPDDRDDDEITQEPIFLVNYNKLWKDDANALNQDLQESSLNQENSVSLDKGNQILDAGIARTRKKRI